MPDPMADVLAARSEYMAARELVNQKRIALGRAIIAARAQGVVQERIAEQLGLTREQVRRYQAEVRKLDEAAASRKRRAR